MISSSEMKSPERMIFRDSFSALRNKENVFLGEVCTSILGSFGGVYSCCGSPFQNSGKYDTMLSQSLMIHERPIVVKKILVSEIVSICQSQNFPKCLLQKGINTGRQFFIGILTYRVTRLFSETNPYLKDRVVWNVRKCQRNHLDVKNKAGRTSLR